MAIIQARTAFLRARQHELERQVQQRTAELHASQEQLQHFAYFDSLTALPNRRAFNDELRAACLGSPRPQDFALAIVDLDGFKSVNDTIGHDAGDALLAVAASRIRSCVREADFVARLGGDEFAIILRGATGLAEAEQACGRIVTEMAAAMTVKNHPVQIGASVGVALFRGAGDTPDDLYKRADMALYDAKRGGRGMWRWYSDRAMHDG